MLIFCKKKDEQYKGKLLLWTILSIVYALISIPLFFVLVTYWVLALDINIFDLLGSKEFFMLLLICFGILSLLLGKRKKTKVLYMEKEVEITLGSSEININNISYSLATIEGIFTLSTERGIHHFYFKTKKRKIDVYYSDSIENEKSMTRLRKWARESNIKIEKDLSLNN